MPFFIFCHVGSGALTIEHVESLPFSYDGMSLIFWRKWLILKYILTSIWELKSPSEQAHSVTASEAAGRTWWCWSWPWLRAAVTK